MFVEVDEFYFYVGAAKELDSVSKTVFFSIDHTADARLNDEFGALQAGRGGNV
jgi:hypothetical protein